MATVKRKDWLEEKAWIIKKTRTNKIIIGED